MKSHHKMSGVDIFAMVLVILGAINLGLAGVFQYDLIQSVFGNVAILVRIVYSLIGIAGIWMIVHLCTCCKGSDK